MKKRTLIVLSGIFSCFGGSLKTKLFKVIISVCLMLVWKLGMPQNSVAPYAFTNFIINYNNDPVSFLYYYNVVLSNSMRKSGSMREISNLLKYKTETDTSTLIMDELLGFEFLMVKANKNNYRTFQVLGHSDSTMLLCNILVSNPCDCKTELFILPPKSQSPVRVEKPFSMSIRKNLIEKLNLSGEFSLDKGDFDSTCEVIQAYF